ncbi:polysaccharide biosynthesis protein [Hahella ganghwensis]|uniref:polysaccharide biosynthesis protein n=1 Tax=Hahella ganghwensis TaxID=286420 RepID=UPI000375AC0E|nr:nucleoside-diphosphate sugar epimerase/dehydratase [Hahella ganghwensis]
MISTVLDSSRIVRQLIAVCWDIVFLFFSLWAALSLRWERLYFTDDMKVLLSLGITVACSLILFAKLGLYRAVIRFMSNHALVAVLSGITISSLVLGASGFILQAQIPRSVPFIYWCLSLVLVGGARLIVRSLVLHRYLRSKEKIVIYGAGSAGLQLSSVLYQGQEYLPIAFVDDNPARQGMILNGLRVHSPSSLQKLINRYGVKRVLLALGNTPRSNRYRVLKRLEEVSIKVQTIPSMTDIVRGVAKISEIRDIDLEDLLGRDAVDGDVGLLEQCISDKVVMVTGAGGSIGSELCRQIVEHRPKMLVLFEHSEYALYSVHQELEQLLEKRHIDIPVKAVFGSVQKRHRMEVVMQSFGVNTVYHAAAYKHVPMVEHNVVEGVRNNLFGTWYTAEAAINAQVETFVLVSTDKAVRPTNVMGASKRLAELVLQALSQRQQATRFCMVRFGNVLGSSGSVVPLFREQISSGGPVTVTHQDITRYFMTIPEAAQLVLQAGALGKGGEVFVLDMGEPVKIDQLARKMIHLMGFEVKSEANPLGDIEIIYTGLRPGEKLYEEVLIGNDPQGTVYPRIMMAREKYLPWHQVEELLKEIDAACHNFDCELVRMLLKKAETDYHPLDETKDLVWLENLQNVESAENVQPIALKR